MEQPSTAGQAKKGSGVLTHVERIGYFIQPDDDKTAVVGFPGLKPEERPTGLKLGDRIEFTMDPDRSGNAATYSKVKSVG